MRFTAITKADVLDDANPNTTPPAAARCATLEELLGAKQNAELGGVALAVRVLTAGAALCADGLVQRATVWIYDEATATWVAAPVSAAQVPVAQSVLVPLPSAGASTKVFVQLQGVSGTSATNVQILVAPITTAEMLAANTSIPTYLAAPPTLSDKQTAAMLLDLLGNLKVTLATSIAGEDRTLGRLADYEAANFTRLSALGTTTIKTGAGVLLGIVVSVKGATANTLTLYDNTAASGTQITGPMDMTGTSAVYIPIKAKFSTGLTAVLASGTSADITLIWL